MDQNGPKLTQIDHKKLIQKDRPKLVEIDRIFDIKQTLTNRRFSMTSYQNHA